MSQVTATAQLYAYISAAWVQLDEVQPITALWGLPDNNPASFIADVGDVIFQLDNSTGQYTPGGPSALAGWKKGIPFKIVFTYASDTWNRFYGTISDIDIRPNNKDKKAYITVTDWMDYATKHSFVNPGIQTNKRSDEAVTSIVSDIGVAPLATDYDTGAETFATMFDAVKPETPIYAELSKISLSELGPIYLKKDKTNGETLVSESSNTRHGWSRGHNPSVVTFDSSIIEDFEAVYGEHIINRMLVSAYPRKLATVSSPKTIELDIGLTAQLASDLPDTNYSDGVDFAVGEYNAGVSTVRTWIKPTFTQLPSSGIKFISAKLRLVPVLDQSDSARTLSAHRCLRTVVHTDATWNEYSETSNFWGTAGCSNSTTDYDGATPLGTLSVPASPTLGTALEMEFTAAGVTEFQKMYDGTYTNNGIILFVDTQSNDQIYYAGINHETPGYKPVIILTYYRDVLFSLADEIVIGSGQTVTIKGNYSDPDSGLRVNAQTMVTPEEQKDYTMFTATGGGGTDITADLAQTSIVYGSEGFTHQVTNNNERVGYINKYNCRGIGIYYHSPIEYVAENSSSITDYGDASGYINQKYKTDLYSGRVFVDSVVDEFNQPKMVLNWISFTANKSDVHMRAFLDTDVGDVRHIDIDELGIDAYFYIQAIEFTLNEGLIICKWYVKAALSLLGGLAPLAIEFDGGSTDGINYGYLPKVSNLTTRSWSVWIYLDDDPVSREYIFGALSSLASDLGAGEYGSGYRISVYTGRKIEFSQAHTGASSADGIWRTPTNSVPLTTWTHILITHDITTPTTDPIIYIDSTAQTLTEVQTPVGSVSAEDANALVLGNNKSAVYNYDSAFDGKIYDPRIYNDIKTAGDAVTLYNSGVINETLVTSGLVFQGFQCKTGDLDSYIDVALTSSLLLRDNIFGAIGTPNGTPTGRNATNRILSLSDDTYFSLDEPTVNFDTSTYFDIGDGSADGSFITRAWIKPDFSNMPSGMRFTSAVLTLTPINDFSTTARTLYAHRCLQGVVSNQATWNIYSTGNNWTSGGASDSSADYDGAVVMGSMAVAASPTLNSPLEMTLDADEFQKLYDGTYTNNGIILFVGTQISDLIRYASKDNATAAYRPTIILTATSAMYKGYIMGGFTSVNVAVIEDLIFSTETSQAIAATLDTAKRLGAGVNSSTKGYIMGGLATGRVAVIEDLIFSTETSQAIAATLDTAKYSGAGVNSSTKGYIMGGFTTVNVAVIEDLIFSTEASQAIAATLDTAKYSGAGVNSSTKGYIMGGFTTGRVAVIEDLIFSTEASQAIAATLDTAKYDGAGVNSSTKGYIMGGLTTVDVAVIEDLIFSTETSQAIAATLDTAKRLGVGVQYGSI